jgi:hypothetical protein
MQTTNLVILHWLILIGCDLTSLTLEVNGCQMLPLISVLSSWNMSLIWEVAQFL